MMPTSDTCDICFASRLPGVFFAVCMAMLMLSLIKSILVVKLLHHSEKEARQMSVSACLLDKYGSAAHSFTESALTSVRTLDRINGGEPRAQRAFQFLTLNMKARRLKALGHVKPRGRSSVLLIGTSSQG